MADNLTGAMLFAFILGVQLLSGLSLLIALGHWRWSSSTPTTAVAFR